MERTQAVEQTGFKRATRSDIELLPGATLTLDFRLDIAAVTEAVLVQGPAPIVDVRTSAAAVLNPTWRRLASAPG